MKTILNILRGHFMIDLLLCTCLACLNSAYAHADEFSKYAPGSLIIKFSSVVIEKNFTIRIEGDLVKTNIGSVDLLNAKYNASSFKPFYFELINPIKDRESGKDRMYVLQFPAFSDMEAIAKEYGRDANVEYAYPNYLFEVTADPNDPA